MKAKMYLRPLQSAHKKTSLAEVLERARETCEYCHPSTPIMCVTECNIWKLRNELGKLSERMENPDFMANLLNVLKNNRRRQILETLSDGRYSVVRLQRKLKKLDYYHSRRTIAEEYVEPLIEVGLVEENHDKYRLTLLGCKLNELMKDFTALGELPPHSECYEEKAIESLSKSPRTYEELKCLIPIESLSRILKRLQNANLITKDNENSYIFYFKTKRKPQQEKLSPTEKRLYKNIPTEGATGPRLADETNISLRRMYKYLRKLRGKKLVFRRKNPKTYTLTKEGAQIAKFIDKTHRLLMEFEQATTEFAAKPLTANQQIPVPDDPKKRDENPLQILIKPNVSI